MPCEKLLEHRSEQERTAAFESELVDVELNLQAAAERDRPRGGEATRNRLHPHRLDAFDLPRQRRVAARCVQLQDLAQRRSILTRVFAHEREIVQ